MNTETEPPYTDPGALLQARILKILKPSLEYWLDEQTLYQTLNLSRPPATRPQLEQALRELRDKAYLDFRVDPLSRLTEWRLTELGRQEQFGSQEPVSGGEGHVIAEAHELLKEALELCDIVMQDHRDAYHVRANKLHCEILTFLSTPNREEEQEQRDIQNGTALETEKL